MNDEQVPESDSHANEQRPLQIPIPSEILKDLSDEKRQEIIHSKYK